MKTLRQKHSEIDCNKQIKQTRSQTSIVWMGIPSRRIHCERVSVSERTQGRKWSTVMVGKQLMRVKQFVQKEGFNRGKSEQNYLAS